MDRIRGGPIMTAPAFSQQGFAEIYDSRIVPPLFVPWVEMILDRLQPRPGERLLDIACGTGVVARRAFARMGGVGQIVGIDLSDEMLAVARTAEPRVDWRQGDAGALPLAAGEMFDLVICHQGLQFFPDRARGAAEMRRALKAGGRLAVAVWGPDTEVPLLQALREAAEAHLGPISDRRHAFGDVAALAAVIRAAGFHRVEAQALTLPARFEDGEEFVRLNARALVGMSPAWAAIDAADRGAVMNAILADSAPVLAAHGGAPGLTWDMRSNLVTAEG
jgi:ubiquinone/menaquinone biosynthesis C-methylase UbiE